MAKEHLEVIVGDDGGVNLSISAKEVARLGAHPGDHLHLVRDDGHMAPRRYKSIRGLGIGKVAPEDILTWEDFEVAHHAIIESVNEKHGDVES